MSEIIDIIHRLLYQVDDTPVKEVNGEIKKSIEYTEKLEKANADLKKQIERTTDAAKKMDLGAQYKKNEVAISQLKDSVNKMSTESSKAEKTTGKLGNGMKTTARAAHELQNKLEDSVDSLTGFSGAGKIADSAVGGLRAALVGPVGITAAIALSTTAIVNAVTKYGSFTEAVKNLTGAETEHWRQERIGLELMQQSSSISGKMIADARILEDIISNTNISLQDRTKAMKEYNDKYGDVIQLQKEDLNDQPKLQEAFAKNNELLLIRIQIIAAKSLIEDYYKQYYQNEVKINNILRGNVGLWQTFRQLLAGGLGFDNTKLNPLIQALDDKSDIKASIDDIMKLMDESIQEYLQKGGTKLADAIGFDSKTGKIKDLDKIKDALKDFSLPFLSSIDEAAIKNYRDKLKEVLAIFGAHWAEYKAKTAEEYKNGILSKKEFDERMLYLESLRLNKVKELLDRFANEHPYVQFFKDQQADINKQLAPIINDLRIQLPDKAGLAPMSKAWQNYADQQQEIIGNGVHQIAEYAQSYGLLSNAAINAFREITSSQQQETQRQIQIEQSRVERAQQIADRGNAEALQKEEERLQKLQKQQEQYARNQIALNSIQTESNAIAAVVKAAAEGGIFAPATIALIIASIAAGIVAVKNLTNDAPGFREGVVDIEGPGTSKSDSIPVRVSRHESIMTADATANNKDILERMNKGERIQEMIDRVMDTSIPMLPSGNPDRFKSHHSSDKDQEKFNMYMLTELKGIKHAIRNKKESSLIIDRNGIAAIAVEFIEEQERRKHL